MLYWSENFIAMRNVATAECTSCLKQRTTNRLIGLDEKTCKLVNAIRNQVLVDAKRKTANVIRYNAESRSSAAVTVLLEASFSQYKLACEK